MKREHDPLVWRCGGRRIDVGTRTFIMGILNVTPDSFSDGGDYTELELAVARALAMLGEGADIIDVGGESTRPGALPVCPEEECRRIIPVVRAIRKQCDCLISVDTTKSMVAREALAAGADIINDVSALAFDSNMSEVVREFSAGVVLMHMQGTPALMQDRPVYGDAVRDVCSYLRDRLVYAQACGIDAEQVVLDPGIGFGKTVAHNLELIAGLPVLCERGRPVLVGLSRKSFLGELAGREIADRLAASLGGMAGVIERGANILRVHDVKESCDVACIIDKIHSVKTFNP